MQNKEEVYSRTIEPLVQQIHNFCEENKIPMLMVFCFEHEETDHDTVKMSLAGSHNLDPKIKPPVPLLLAAGMLQVPGFRVVEASDNVPTETDQVH